VHLVTEFHAIIDGTDGNTYLQPVEAHFGHSVVIARGSVEKKEGESGKTVTLDADVSQGRLEDMMRLAVKSDDLMTGAVSFRTQIVIPPGDIDITEKLQLDGAFSIASARFSKLSVQQKVNELSHRSEGDPEDNASDNTASNFGGRFKLAGGVMTFSRLSFEVPGAVVSLDGTYQLLSRKIDLKGTARLQAKLSETTTGWKSFLLKALDPWFKKKGAGAVLPIKIEGTADAPAFGLRVG
jgi:hypothetical protein